MTVNEFHNFSPWNMWETLNCAATSDTTKWCQRSIASNLVAAAAEWELQWQRKKNFQRIPVEASCCKSLSGCVSVWPHGRELPAAVVRREPVSRPCHHTTPHPRTPMPYFLILVYSSHRSVFGAGHLLSQCQTFAVHLLLTWWLCCLFVLLSSYSEL